ncbi:MAG: thiamine diphosphokinase [Paracoccaceae bacterium]
MDKPLSKEAAAGGPALPVRFADGVTLIGGGPVRVEDLDEARRLAPRLIAADRGADTALSLGARPDLVVGDMDSISDPTAWRRTGTPFVHLPEQETTDFEKCLYATEAPFYVAVGVSGRRIDHLLAVFHALLRRPEKTAVLLAETEAIALLPAGRVLRLGLAEGARVSLFPLRPVRGLRSQGLAWPIEGLELAPGEQIGTSNRASAPEVAVGVEGAGCLLMLERPHAAALLGAIRPQ